MSRLSVRDERKPRRNAATQLDRLVPSNVLMSAAISGLVGFAGACDDETPPAAEDDPDTRTDAIATECEHDDDAPSGKGGTAGKGGAGGKGGSGGAEASASSIDDEVEKEISTTDVQHTFAELTKMCDDRKGYVEILGSCSGVNTCKGFTYGDWDEESQLLEHTCAGANGCAGLSCLIPSREGSTGDMTGEEIMKLDDNWFLERTGSYGAKACRQCHIESKHNDETGDYDYNYAQLKIPVMPGMGRTANNWTQRSTAYQEKIVAFGAHSISDDGLRVTSMASYAKVFSKEEIRRIVAYMRNYDPKNVTIKELKLQPGKAE